MPRDLEPPDLPPPGTPDPLARALAGLDPAPAALNRDRLMFDAGAASRRPVIRLWQLAAGAMAAVGFAAGLNWRPPVVVVREVVAGGGAPAGRPVPRDPPAPPPPEVAAEPPPPARESSAPRPVAAAAGKSRLTPGAGYWLRRQHEALSVVLAIIPDRSRAGYRAGS
jgi:hypothetical protein